VLYDGTVNCVFVCRLSTRWRGFGDEGAKDRVLQEAVVSSCDSGLQELTNNDCCVPVFGLGMFVELSRSKSTLASLFPNDLAR
jgi:hypothetical protein